MEDNFDLDYNFTGEPGGKPGLYSELDELYGGVDGNLQSGNHENGHGNDQGNDHGNDQENGAFIQYNVLPQNSQFPSTENQFSNGKVFNLDSQFGGDAQQNPSFQVNTGSFQNGTHQGLNGSIDSNAHGNLYMNGGQSRQQPSITTQPESSYENFDYPNISLNMPGAFRNDHMDLDDSPPFTIGLDTYNERALESLNHETESVFKNNLNPNKRSYSKYGDSPFNDSSRVSSVNNMNNVTERTYNFSNEGNFNVDGTFNVSPNSANANISPNTPNTLPSIQKQRSRKESIDSYYLNLNVPLPHSFSNASVNNHLYELSPLTTTTSLTPSLGSVHSAQPSFFSAHQHFNRNSIDQPPLSIHRPSFDLMYPNRPSMDSQQSQHSQHSQSQPPVRGKYTSFTNSITNMIPFMGDKPRPTGPPSPSYMSNLQRQPQSRHLIRSIFKSNNVPELDVFGQDIEMYIDSGIENEVERVEVKQEEHDDEYFLMSPKDESDLKKSKRSKRLLFTRFKPLKTEPENDEIKEEPDSESLQNSLTGNVSFQNSISATPSLNVDAGLNNSQQPSMLEPDYAALFENVGKRKNIVPRKKTKPKVEDEYSEGSGSESEATSEHLSAASSNTSSFNNGEAVDSASITSASKRVLGSKLLAKKNAIRKEKPNDGVEVEVDLESLDLPANTQIFPTSVINSKSRTRGRKENKEADMVDLSKIYLCNYCSRRFKRQEHLKRHFRSLHTFEKPYDCTICNKKFSRSDNLNQHLKTHKEEEEQLLREQQQQQEQQQHSGVESAETLQVLESVKE